MLDDDWMEYCLEYFILFLYLYLIFQTYQDHENSGKSFQVLL